VIDDVEVGEAGRKGRGVFARRPFAEGEFIFRRSHARVVGADEVATLSTVERMHLCELGGDRFAVLAPPGCYLNHSCDPNAMRHGVTVFAWRPIAAGDEITIDYRLNALDGDTWPCDCGAASCTGIVAGSFFAMEPARQRLLLPHAPDFIRREHRRRARHRPSAGGHWGMSATGSGRAGYHAVTPRIVVHDVAAQVDFLCVVLGGTAAVEADGPTEVRIGDSVVMVTPATEREPFPAFLYVYVDDADEAHRRAVAAGATTLEAPRDTPYGDRRAMVRDPFGNVLQLAHQVPPP
jgi:PhnB protein